MSIANRITKRFILLVLGIGTLLTVGHVLIMCPVHFQRTALASAVHALDAKREGGISDAMRRDSDPSQNRWHDAPPPIELAHFYRVAHSVKQVTSFDCPAAVVQKYPAIRRAPRHVPGRSQAGEDAYMYERFFHATNPAAGRFVELGALDGLRYSNSYLFEKLGWGGVLIEGETTNFAALEQNRQGTGVTCLHAAVCEAPGILRIRGTGPMAAAAGTQLHTTTANPARESTVPCLPMSTLLAMVGNLTHIDFFSIDVEGAELAVILSHDFHAVPVHAILVEMRPADEADWSNARIRQALWARRFCRFAADVGHNNEVWVNPHWWRPI